MLLVAIKVWRQKYGGLLSFVFFSLAFSLGEIIFEISVLNVLSKNVLSKKNLLGIVSLLCVSEQ